MTKTYTSRPGIERKLHVPCTFCGTNRHSTVLSSPECTFVRCSSCGLVYQNPVPVFDDLRLRYADEYFNYELENEANFFELMKLGLRDIDFEGYETRLRATGNFLDIGCATGMLIAYMKNRGWTVHGVDICAESACYGVRERGVPIFIGTLEEANFPDRHFSVIHFSHLIEHVLDPAGVLAEVRRIMCDDGIAIITTPNRDGLQARLLGMHWRSAIPDHLHLFTKKTMLLFLDAAGFTVQKTITWGGIAKGLAPGFLKRPIDVLAKKFGFGDVILFLVSKRTM
jgi:2-polyprenyl-3-methyl-5-hydroxy-6-metoxy-1,4-benzoquinol methylase